MARGAKPGNQLATKSVTRQKGLHVRVTEEQKDDIQALAFAAGLSLSDLVHAGLNAYRQQHPDQSAEANDFFAWCSRGLRSCSRDDWEIYRAGGEP